jgi:hypothetical protein
MMPPSGRDRPEQLILGQQRPDDASVLGTNCHAGAHCANAAQSLNALCASIDAGVRLELLLISPEAILQNLYVIKEISYGTTNPRRSVGAGSARPLPSH